MKKREYASATGHFGPVNPAAGVHPEGLCRLPYTAPIAPTLFPVRTKFPTALESPIVDIR